jgi:hypothetical protein
MNLVLTPPLLGFVVGTRAALAFGFGLLVADRIPESRRRSVGLALVALGVATTIPAAVSVFGSRVPAPDSGDFRSGWFVQQKGPEFRA